MIRRNFVHHIRQFCVETSRFAYIRDIKAIPIAVVVRIPGAKVFDGEFEQITFATMDSIEPLQLRSLFEVVGDYIGGQVGAVPLVDCA
jgi:hypothetical protein